MSIVDSSPLSDVSGNTNDLAWCSAADNREIYQQMVEDGHAPQLQYVNGHWMDINNPGDLESAANFARTPGE